MKSQTKILIALMSISASWISCSESSKLESNSIASVTESASLPDTAMVADRVIIKTAEISMDVKNVEQSIQDFQQMLRTVNGHVYHYEIKNEKQFQSEVEHSLDSTLVLNQVYPTGYLKVKVPVAYADTFISNVINMNGQISNFMFDENDVTEDITEKKELMLSDVQSSNTSNKPRKIDEKYFDKETKESYIKRKAEFSKVNFQTKNLWFDIHLKGTSYIDKQLISTAKSYRTPFYVRALKSLDNGWYVFSLFIIGVLQLWPFLILATLIFISIKKKWHKLIFK